MFPPPPPSQIGIIALDLGFWRIVRRSPEQRGVALGPLHVCRSFRGTACCRRLVQVPVGKNGDHGEVEALEREIDLLKDLNHPNVVQYFGTDRDDAKHKLYIFIECVRMFFASV